MSQSNLVEVTSEGIVTFNQVDDTSMAGLTFEVKFLAFLSEIDPDGAYA